MKILRKQFQEYSGREDGSLLVFFAVCSVAILLIVALSFDMGRRASTQTDMQSFADNVALAAAGELDGAADAITRARSAAQNVVIAANERLKAGTGAGNTTITFNPVTDLVFYSSLPNSDRPTNYSTSALAASKYTLPTSTITTDPAEAVYVGVRLNTVDVNWMFARIIESAPGLPSSAIGAIAVAGISGWTCKTAPLMFCLPRDASGQVEDLDPGIAVQLQTVGQGAAWNPGEFGYLDVSSIPNSVSGTCAGVTPESRFQACILAKGLSACYNNRGVDIQTGQRGGQEPSGFNLPFGIFGQAMNQLSGNPDYATGPHTIAGQILNSGNCRAGGNGNNNSGAAATMAFPPDTCHPNCTSTTGHARFGDGNWDRELYADTNYTFTKPDGTVVDGSDFFDFPSSLSLTRYQYYLLEIQRAANGGVMDDAGTAPYTDAKYLEDSSRGSVNAYDSWDDYWDDITTGLNPIIPPALGRQDDGLPQCSSVRNNATANANRRVLVIAGIDCPPAPNNLTGDEDDVPVEQYYEVFLLAPARDDTGDTEGPNGNGSNGSFAPQFQIFVEIIRPIGGESNGSTVSNTAFRQLVQLYR